MTSAPTLATTDEAAFVPSQQDFDALLGETRRQLLMSNPLLARLPNFNDELNSAFSQFTQQSLQRGEDSRDVFNRTVKPVIDKYSVPAMPTVPKWQPQDKTQYDDLLQESKDLRIKAAEVQPKDASVAAATLAQQQRTQLMDSSENAARQASEIEAKYPVRPSPFTPQSQPENIVDLGTDSSGVAALPFGTKYRLNGGVFQTFHPTAPAPQNQPALSTPPDADTVPMPPARPQLTDQQFQNFAKTASATANPSDDRLRVKSPDGKIGTIPKSQLADALKSGYIQVQ